MRPPEFYSNHNNSTECDICLDPQKSFVKLFKRSVVLLAGPTASGKTEVSLYLAPMINGEVVSVDSMQVYCGMDIGTAKVPLSSRKSIPHHLIDICHVQELFNAVDFYYHAVQACQSILARNKVPILVGGSGFYFHTFLVGPPEGPPADNEFRQQLLSSIEEHGLSPLYENLARKDPEYVRTITKNDRNKIIRGLEIIHITGKKVSEHSWVSKSSNPKEFNCRGWFLSPPKDVLKNNIINRCEKMLEDGLIDEVANLLNQGLLDNPSASKAIGYREWIDFLNRGGGSELYEQTKEQFIANSWQYTKKQKTWFRRYSTFQNINTLGMSAESIAQKIAQDYFLHG
ncbi:tRNA dimethylallyltransferase [Chlamydia ibidis]|uniref:tRNA dimethylallyltransferase n=2 Tax=Chlamydia ibidis TaxID=1405396 RepID=S7J2I8_9CHLA|nr:tRNA (adenosine(37)-N6)-dimethylallyltransferase MiaA [Chlamydia ibidis]EPP34448.1 tRNA dimethylallyltransferase [Chlamydia ibidis]EQM62407.1 tRNA dimethylallyltransferase [Chlamydia ibidis 10-1398/6]